ncbi:MAG: pantoate--beta-alanine ligase, partial [Spirochaetota bacterium]|nr:pantoate--beta-alanine ligase [Spirochaetota bacterium]
KKLNVDYLFLPDAKDIYPSNYSTYVTVENITNKLCGLSRPNHFRGVTTICTKLFHITLPTISYFGQKDYQQSLIVKRLVKDLNIPTTIKILPIARDSDGLALSSRNVYLSEKERIESTNLYKSLQNAETIIQKGEKNCQFIKETIKNHLTKTPMIKIDYISICNPDTLEEVDQLDKGEVLIAIAAYLGKTRLIDNSLIQVSN